MNATIAHRVRWFGVWILVGLWFAGLALKWFGDWLNLVLVVAILLVLYELMADDRYGETPASSAEVHALSVGEKKR